MPCPDGQPRPVAQQGRGKGGKPRRIRLERCRRAGLDGPSGRGGTGHRAGGDADHEQGHARSAGGQRQPARRGEIGSLGLPPRLHQHRAECRAAGRLGTGAQHARLISRPNEDQTIRIETELHEPWDIELPRLDLEDVLPCPQDRAIARGPERQAQREAGRGGHVGHGQSVDLVQGPPRETPQRLVDLRRPAGERGGSAELRTLPQTGERLLQHGQGVSCRAHHRSRFVLIQRLGAP